MVSLLGRCESEDRFGSCDSYYRQKDAICNTYRLARMSFRGLAGDLMNVVLSYNPECDIECGCGSSRP